MIDAYNFAVRSDGVLENWVNKCELSFVEILSRMWTWFDANRVTLFGSKLSRYYNFYPFHGDIIDMPEQWVGSLSF